MDQSDPASRHPFRYGDLVAGKYRIDRVIGEGGMGVVVAATHEALEQRVALKFLLPEVAARVELVARFVREARNAAKIQSEHVARVLDVGVHDGSPYMVMEYLEGEDVGRLLEERGLLPIQEAVGYVLEACEAIAEAHAAGIVHRDLKPPNLFLAKRSTGTTMVKVLDFGISKATATKRDAHVTKTADVLGSPGYMSPEQLVAAKSVDARSDLWSLGVVLYELVSGTLPFRAESMPELVGAILHNAPEPLAASCGVPLDVVAILNRCMQKDPANRYANVAELARALAPFGPARCEISVERIEHVLGSRRASTDRVVVASAASSAATFAVGVSTLAATSSGPTRRKSRSILLAPLLLLATLGFAAAMLLARAPSGSPSSEGGSPVPTLAASPVAAESARPVEPRGPDGAAVAPSPPPTGSPPAESSAAAAPAHRRPAPAVPPPHSAPVSSARPCRTVSYIDASGDMHFKEECK